MSSKLERFTQHARTVLQFAQEEAVRMRHNYIGTEHLLIGLVREPNGIAGKVLRSAGSEADRVAALVENMTGVGGIVEGKKQDLTPRAKQGIEYTVEESRKLGHNYLGTEHMLLALLRQREGVAIDVL
jgi:ATP-dependent Clp protease ATP-binding subunit ClpC